MKIDGEIDIVATGLPQLGEFLGSVAHLGRRLQVPRGTMLARPGLECGEALGDLFLEALRSAGMGINTNPLPGRTAQELVNRDPQRLPLDVPECLIDAAERTG